MSYTPEQQHKARIAAMPCILCTVLGMKQTSRTSVHHIREGQGMSQRSSHWLSIPLCIDQCHQGKNGIHGDRSLLHVAKCTELDLLAMTLKAILG
jgi:hypothetical protein